LTRRAWIGNDVVDLAEPGVAGKEHDRRFMDRVFTLEERARILDAAAPTIALWKTWAAKETAYKVASKIREGLVFRHRAFEVLPEPEPSASALVTPATAPIVGPTGEPISSFQQWAARAWQRHLATREDGQASTAGLLAGWAAAWSQRYAEESERTAAGGDAAGRDGSDSVRGSVTLHTGLAEAAHRAIVRFEDLEIPVRWQMAREYIHCIGQVARDRVSAGIVAAQADDPSPTGVADVWRDWRRVMADIVGESQPLHGELTMAEQASVHSTASERVRLLARELMQRWDLHGAEVLRLWRTWGWGPPVVVQEGQPVADYDVSLSHDGRFVAAALAGPFK
jgi:phosphopantetheine--protein transferase-like protein